MRYIIISLIFLALPTMALYSTVSKAVDKKEQLSDDSQKTLRKLQKKADKTCDPDQLLRVPMFN